MNEDPIAETLEQVRALPERAVAGVFARYGKPLAVELPPISDDDQSVEIEAGRVRALRYRVPVDVIANDWFVLERQGHEPLAIPGPLFAAAIAALARRGDGGKL